ncbi:aminotransferase [Verrucomicrobiota bacterium]|jgi:aminotransferase|nr:aminotransferase class I/II-fold pyridoxal phosphate-dependent enzyme [Verrucomicrobiota bacterium]GDX11468.1 aminotransferase [Verrucomicrobiota bacterium]
MLLSKHIANHVRDIPRSGIRDFFEIVQTMADVISLGIGEPDFHTPWRIREAAIYGLERGHTGYTSNLGLPKLRERIAQYVQKHFHVGYDPATEIIVTVGVSEAIDLALRALLNPGDEVLYHEPCYVSYSPSVVLAHGVPVAVPTFATDNFRMTAEELAKLITPRSKVLMMNFPCNPTGATQTREELEKIAALCVKHDLIVLTDEIYSELTYDGAEHVSIAALKGMRERTVFLHGFSKAFAMTGFRIGYACAPPALTEAMMKIHQYAILCANTMAQDAAIEALESGDGDVAMMRKEYEARRNFIVRSLNDMGLPCFKPLGAFYVFPDITSTGLTSKEFSLRLLQEKKVACVPGPAFGVSGTGHVRCSYATSMEKIKIAMQRMAEFVTEVRK